MKLWRYTGVLIGLSVICAGIMALLETYAGLEGRGSVSGIVAVIGAAMFEGQFFAKAEGRVPEKAEKERFARIATLVNLILTVVLFLPLSVGMPELTDPAVLPFMGGAMIFVLIFIYFSSGHFYVRGAKGVLKAAERKRANAEG